MQQSQETPSLLRSSPIAHIVRLLAPIHWTSVESGQSLQKKLICMHLFYVKYIYLIVIEFFVHFVPQKIQIFSIVIEL